jgi:hypothetical protein
MGSDADGGKANVVDVEVEMVGGAATPAVVNAVGVVGDVPDTEAVLMGARLGETLAGPRPAGAPKRLFMLPAESRAP